MRQRAMASMGTLFQNLNGFKAAVGARSRAIVPSHTQGMSRRGATQQSSLAFSQASSRTSTHRSRGHYSLSQKHCAESLASQRSLMASLSQSVRVSVRRRRGGRIPCERYLRLRLDLSQEMDESELPLALKHGARSPTPVGCRTNPVSPRSEGVAGAGGRRQGAVRAGQLRCHAPRPHRGERLLATDGARRR